MDQAAGKNTPKPNPHLSKDLKSDFSLDHML